MDPAQSRRLDAYEGGSTNPGPHYSGNANTRPADRTDVLPGVGQRVCHAKSGERGTVTGVHVHGHTGERYPTVRWDGQPSKGFTQDQGYSLDSLTTP